MVAEKLSEFRLKMIRLYDLRHYYGTMIYHRTEDILYTKAKMGDSRSLQAGGRRFEYACDFQG